MLIGGITYASSEEAYAFHSYKAASALSDR